MIIIYSLLQDGLYMPVKLEKRIIDVRPSHVCITKKPVAICAIDDNGKIINAIAVEKLILSEPYISIKINYKLH